MQAVEQEQLEQWRLCLTEGQRRERTDLGSAQAAVDKHIISSYVFKRVLNEIAAVAEYVAYLTPRTATSLCQRTMWLKSRAEAGKWIAVSQQSLDQLEPNFTTRKLTLSHFTTTIRFLLFFIGSVDLIRTASVSVFCPKLGLVI